MYPDVLYKEELSQDYRVHFQMRVVEYNCKQCYVEMVLFQFFITFAFLM